MSLKMSTAGFTTKDDEVKVEYMRIDDSIIPQEKETPLIKSLVNLKIVFLAITLLYGILLKLWLNNDLNIDAVYFIRKNWNMQMITDFKSVP